MAFIVKLYASQLEIMYKWINKGKLVADIVDHMPKEIARAIWFFLECVGGINGKVFEEKYRPSPVTKGRLGMLSAELRVVDERRNILERFKEIIQGNYLKNVNTNSYQINDLAVINFQNEGSRESKEDEEERDHLIDDKKEEVVFPDWTVL